MSVFGLTEFLNRDSSIKADGSSDLWRVDSAFCVPGFWVSLAALARHNDISYEQIIVTDEGRHRGYCEAIGLPAALRAGDPYPYYRKNEGHNYSPLVLLDDASLTDRATTDVNGCIRQLGHGLEVDRFTSQLCEVVGDLHDNVWSHGKSTGFSMAQRWKDFRNSGEHVFEFALADCGIGFLREMRRVGLEPRDNEEAIQWCIQRGNSSKLHAAQRSDDDWSQWMPPDMTGNPMGGVGLIKTSDNHHQGLGLAKLVSLVESYCGELCLTTGNSVLTVDSNGRRSFRTPRHEWPGVALSCRFSSIQIKRCAEAAVEMTDSITIDLMKLLGGGHE